MKISKFDLTESESNKLERNSVAIALLRELIKKNPRFKVGLKNQTQVLIY